MTLLSWSGGKDCAWALHVLRESGVEPAALITTINESNGRIAMHGVRAELLAAQAEAAGVALWTVPLPWPCSNADYERRMRALCERARDTGADSIAFGDLFLRDIRAYRERQFANSGMRPLFPLWNLATGDLARAMIASGVRARIACLDPGVLPREAAGREWDLDFLNELPVGVDPCGENGEFHTFVYDGPMFRHAVPVRAGEVREIDGFVYADLE